MGERVAAVEVRLYAIETSLAEMVGLTRPIGEAAERTGEDLTREIASRRETDARVSALEKLVERVRGAGIAWKAGGAGTLALLLTLVWFLVGDDLRALKTPPARVAVLERTVPRRSPDMETPMPVVCSAAEPH